MLGAKNVWWIVTLCACLCLGCGSGVTDPALGVVTGTVTVDGAPSANLDIVFVPEGVGKEGGTSSGRTNAEGHYELSYMGAGKMGAPIGKHKVRITRIAGGGPAGGATGEAVSNPIPANYNLETSLTADVHAGENTVNFALTTR